MVYPYCATCFGRCYPNGAALIIEARSTFDGVSQLITVSPVRGLKNPVEETKQASESGNGPVAVVTGASVDDSVLKHNITDQSVTETNRLESRSSI